MKAFAYLRVSGINQVEGDGFDRQLITIQRYVAKHNIELDYDGVFREEGVSGKKELEDRPALQALYAAIEASPDTKTILIERLDRLARDLMVQETIIADLQKSGYTLISVAEPDLCVDDPSRKLMRQIFGAIAEYDRAMIVLKLRGARERTRAKKGRCEGQKPYGHYPGEEKILGHMLEWKREGLSAIQIAHYANKNIWKSRSGRRWSAAVVARILKRELHSTQEQHVCA